MLCRRVLCWRDAICFPWKKWWILAINTMDVTKAEKLISLNILLFTSMFQRKQWKIINLIYLRELFSLFPLPRELFLLPAFFNSWNDKMLKWHDWGHILSCLIHVLYNTFYNNKKHTLLLLKSKRRRWRGNGNILTWKTHILNKNKCVYKMQRFVIKNFNVMLKHFFKIYSNIIILMAFFLLPPATLFFHVGLHPGFLFSTILDRSTVSVSKEARRGAAISRIRFREKYLGSRYVLC